MESSNQTMTIVPGVTYTVTSSGDVITGTEKRIVVSNVSSSSAALVTQGILYGILLCLGMLFNCCVVWLIRHKRSLHTVTNMWVTSLCISQVLICAISLPIMILSVISDDWLLGGAFCRIFGFYTSCLRTVTILSVAGIALDRYHVVTRPFSARIRKSSARILIILTWWCGVVASLPPLFGIGLYRYSPSSHLCGISWSLGGSALVFTVFYVTSVYILSLMTTSFSYKLIYQVTRAQVEKRKRPSFAGGLASSVMSNRSRSGRGNDYATGSATDDEVQVNTYAVRNKRGSPARRRLTSVLNGKLSRSRGSLRQRLSVTLSGSYSHSNIDHRAALTIVLVLTTFLFTWVPYFVFGLYSAVARDNVFSTATSWTEFLTTWLSFSNVIWDPLLYGALNHNFRAHLREWFCCGRVNFNEFFKKTNRNFRSSDENERSSTAAANWREIIKSEEQGDRENTVYGRGATFDDLQEQMSESAHTMTSLDGDVILSSESSRHQSGLDARNSAASKIFFTPSGVESDVVVHDLQTFSRSPRPSVTPTSLQPKIAMKRLSSKRSMTSQLLGNQSKSASRDSYLDDVTVTQDGRQSSSNFDLASRAGSVNSRLPLPMTLADNKQGTLRSNMSSFRLNGRLSTSGRFRMSALSNRKSSAPTGLFFAKSGKKSQGHDEDTFSNSLAASPVQMIHDPYKSRLKTFSSSSSAISTRRSKLSSESGRLRRQKVRSQPGEKIHNHRGVKRLKMYQSATAL